jgi:ketosteroid isomerase-like protein
MYKAAVRWMIRRNIAALNAGNYQPVLRRYAADATLTFPGDNSWSRMYREPDPGRAPAPTHRGRAEIEAFLQRYVGNRIQMEVEDILVNGPPWNTRAAVVVHDWVADPNGGDAYANRAVLFIRTRWGKTRTHEDFEDTERAAAFDAYAPA